MSREEQERAAARDIPHLRMWADELLAVAEAFGEATAGKEYPITDHFGFMLLIFASKQTEHMRSIRKLGPSLDSALIARSMLEGMAQILWTAESPQARAERWRAYTFVHDWRKLAFLDAAGTHIDSDERSQVVEGLRKYGSWFYTATAKKKRAKSQRLPDDPYVNHWTGLRMWEIFEAADKADVYRTAYGQFCDWHHWSPGGIGMAIVKRGEALSYASGSNFAEAGALANGFLSLFTVLGIAEDHLRTGLRERIVRAGNGYLQRFGGATGGGVGETEAEATAT